MKARDEDEQSRQLSELWLKSAPPGPARLEDEAAGRLREQRMVGAIGDAIVRERRAVGRGRFARAVWGLALAASVAGAAVVGFSGREWTERRPGKEVGVTATGAGDQASLGGVETSGIVTLKRGRAPSVIDVSTLLAGDRITTAVNATAALTLGQTVRASVAGATEVSVEAPHKATQRMRLDRGRIEATVDSRASALPKLVVETPDVQVVVTGTILGVEVTSGVDSSTVTRVTVTVGSVEVHRHGSRVATVAAGQSWSSAAPPVATAGPVPGERGATVGAALGTEHRQGAPEGRSGGSAPGTLALENALFEAAMGARKRGSPHVALGHLHDLLTRYPASPLAAEARLERMRVLEKLGRKGEAVREAQRYLTDAPRDAVRAEAERVLAEEGKPEDGR